MNRNFWVYDIETIKSCFTYTSINIDTQEVKKFVIHKSKDQHIELIDHLQTECSGLIGFNNIGFDYPVLHELLNAFFIWIQEATENFIHDKTPEFIIDFIYNTAQNIISQQDKSDFNSIVNKATKECKIPQLDLFKLWHYNNKARMTSLKALEISMNYPNVMEMSISHTEENVTIEQIKDILEYNLNDVLATYEFYKLSQEKINLRKELNKKYNLECINYPDSKIGEQLMLKLYCEKTDNNIWEVRKMRTHRNNIKIKDCIFDYIKFKSKEFNSFLDSLKQKVITETKGALTASVVFKSFKYDFGSGGIHGCIKAGIYEADEDYLIIDADVGSLYPSIAIVNNLYPKHLGKEFTDVYKNEIIIPRLAAKKAGDMVISDGFKLSANSVYGKSNDVYSFLYDPMYTMKTTINGQLMIAMLCEALVTRISNITMLQVNTDGLTVKIHKSELEEYYKICEAWEKYTKLGLEYVDYKCMIIRDVNNYIAVTTKGKAKFKGAFEIDKEYHKDPSFRIIPIALYNYLVNKIPIETTIKNHLSGVEYSFCKNNEIYDFCGRQKFKGNDYGETHSIKNYSLNIEKQQKNTRYYISTNGSTFIKQYAKGSQEFIHVGYQVTIFNKYIEEDYNINYDYYIRECNKEILNIIDNQLSLF